MAMPQRDETIEEIKRLERPSRIRFGVSSALLEYAQGTMDWDEVTNVVVEQWKTEKALIAQ